MIINLIPEFLAARAAADREAAYHDYLERHRQVLGAYWHNYVLDLASPHAAEVVVARPRRGPPGPAAAGRGGGSRGAGRRRREPRRRACWSSTRRWTSTSRWAWAPPTRPSWSSADAAWSSSASSTSPASPTPTPSASVSRPRLLPLWIAHEIAHTVRYTSPTSRSELKRLVAEAGGEYDYWETGSRATLRELLAQRRRGRARGAGHGAGPGGRGVPRLHPAAVPPDAGAGIVPVPRRRARPGPHRASGSGCGS